MFPILQTYRFSFVDVLRTDRRRRLIQTLTVVAAASMVVGCKPRGEASQAKMERPAPQVTVAKAIMQDVPVYLDEIGKCVAIESVTIAPRVTGPILKRHVEDGADVKAGQPLFTIDPDPYQAELEASQANLQQALASLSLAKIEFQRYASVAGTNAVTQTDYDSKKNDVDVAEAQVAAAKAALKSAQLNRDYCSIVSPINGRTGSRLVDVGNIVTANTTQLLSIQRLDPIYADFTVNERELVGVRTEMAKGTLKAMVTLPASNDAGREGKLTFLDNTVQDATGTVRLRVEIPNADTHFWPGQFVNVKLILQVKAHAVLVPDSAQQMAQNFGYVLVVDEKNIAHIRPVKFGQQHGKLIVVEPIPGAGPNGSPLGGVKPGETVVTDGQVMVAPDSPVTINTGMPPHGFPGAGKGGAGHGAATTGAASQGAAATTRPSADGAHQ